MIAERQKRLNILRVKNFEIGAGMPRQSINSVQMSKYAQKMQRQFLQIHGGKDRQPLKGDTTSSNRLGTKSAMNEGTATITGQRLSSSSLPPVYDSRSRYQSYMHRESGAGQGKVDASANTQKEMQD